MAALSPGAMKNRGLGREQVQVLGDLALSSETSLEAVRAASL